MVSSGERRDGVPVTPTVNPQALIRFGDLKHGPFPSKRFNAEEWENWMQWDGAVDSLSPKSTSDQSSPGFQGGSISQESTSPSEAESVHLPSLAPVYRIPLIDATRKHKDANAELRRAPTRKRKPAASADLQGGRTRQPKGQKISHNVIEKRYRTNLNDKIARLRDSVPVLKTAFEANQKTDSKEDGSDSDGSGFEDKAATTNVKFNKATVLTKATEYIEQLERANAKLLSENSTLRKRVTDTSSTVQVPHPLYFRADEADASGSSLSNQTSLGAQLESRSASSVSPSQISGKIPVAAEYQRLRAEATDQPSYAPLASVSDLLSAPATAQGGEKLCEPTVVTSRTDHLIDFDNVRGSIPVPDYLRQNRVPISQQQHYAPTSVRSGHEILPQDTFVMDGDYSPVWWPRNRASKLLLGSLVGLMIMEGFNANEDKSVKSAPLPKKQVPQKRGLISLPDEFYTESRGFRIQIRQRIIDFAHSPQGRNALPVLVFCLAVLGVGFLALLYLSHNDPKMRRRANSISSNIDRNDSGCSAFDLDGREISNTLESATRFEDGISDKKIWLGNGFSSKGHGVLDEAIARLRGCWRILVRGDTVVY